jgi:hypothetical protein
MTDTIEPTEEQCEAVKAWCTTELGVRYGWRHIARFLAKREHKLREELTAQCNPDVDMCGGCEACVELKRNQLDYALSHAAEERRALQADLDAARARIAELEKSDALLGRHAELVEQMEAREAAQIQRIADLEAKIKDACFSCPGCGRHDFGFFASQIKAACGPCRVRAESAEAREAAHLAHIKALHQFIGDREEEEGIWIPRAEFKDIPKHDTAHYDVEGGEG